MDIPRSYLAFPLQTSIKGHQHTRRMRVLEVGSATTESQKWPQVVTKSVML